MTLSPAQWLAAALAGWCSVSLACALVIGRVLAGRRPWSDALAYSDGLDGAIRASSAGSWGSGSVGGARFGPAERSTVDAVPHPLGVVGQQAAERCEGPATFLSGGACDRLPVAVALSVGPSSRRRLVEVVAAAVVGGGVAAAVFVPQLVAARADAAGTRAEYGHLVEGCTVFVDGSATCPAKSFRVVAP